MWNRNHTLYLKPFKLISLDSSFYEFQQNATLNMAVRLPYAPEAHENIYSYTFMTAILKYEMNIKFMSTAYNFCMG